MTVGIASNYNVRVSYGENVLIMDPRGIRELSITCDLKSFLPSFRMRVGDASGELTHLTHIDEIRKLTIDVTAGASDLSNYNSYDFHVYRKFPLSDGVFDVEGLLEVDTLFTKSFIRGFNQTIYDTISDIGNEIGVDEVEISDGLRYVKKVVQPNWSNAQLLGYLRDNAVGSEGALGYYCFVKVVEGKKILVFRSIQDMIMSPITHKFIVGSDNSVVPEETDDKIYYPVFKWSVLDGYRTNGVLGMKSRSYTYFDYGESELVGSSVELDDFPSLCDVYAVSIEDLDENVGEVKGINNAFTSDFRGPVGGNYFKQNLDASKIWVDTIGLGNIYPGRTVMLKFCSPADAGYEPSLQYQGFWLVEKVIHTFGMNYVCRLLLTRNGYDVGDKNTKLVKCARERRKKL